MTTNIQLDQSEVPEYDIIPQDKRAEMALDIEDESTKSLLLRYGMNPITWEASKRTGIIYNSSLKLVVGLPLVLPLVVMFVDLIFVNTDYKQTKVGIQTIIASFIGYLLTDKMIVAFKDDLRVKGLFGRDLNKAGEQKDKEQV